MIIEILLVKEKIRNMIIYLNTLLNLLLSLLQIT